MNFFSHQNPFKESYSGSAGILEESALNRALEDETTNNWVPPADILENNVEYLFKLDLPGLNKSEMRVQRQMGNLVISGGRDLDIGKNKNRILRQERPRGYFMRRFPLPDDASRDQISAKFCDGVLQVRARKMPANAQQSDNLERFEIEIR